MYRSQGQHRNPSSILRYDQAFAPHKFAASYEVWAEGEFIIVTSKDARDVSVEDAHKYILGFTIGNDLTARAYQDPKRAGNQFTRCKAFDGFAPIGPFLMEASALGDHREKRITTTVNGKTFQNSSIDLIHGPAQLLSFLSEGDFTLQPDRGNS
jgi:2-keto-4-pentenoate hydratase/2-oxohepta-3-ene-1,7-dioic acid hydratase in catechol pathway